MTNDECILKTVKELAEKHREFGRMTVRLEELDGQLVKGKSAIELSLRLTVSAYEETQFDLPQDWPSHEEIKTVYQNRLELCKRIAVLNNRLREWGIIK